MRIIADGKFLAIEDSDLKTVEKYPIQSTPFRLLLADSVDLDRDARIVGVETQEGTLSVSLEDKSNDAAGSISGKVFGVQGDAVELYQPFTSVAVIQNHDTRFTPEGIAARAHELFDASGINPEVENMMAKLRFTMTERADL